MSRRPRGDRFSQDYDELGGLGSGSFGTVIKAQHKLSHKIYAMKEITDLQGTPESEARTLANLTHTHIVVYSDSFFDYMPHHRGGGDISSSWPTIPLGHPISVQHGLSETMATADNVPAENMEVGTTSTGGSAQQTAVNIVTQVNADSAIDNRQLATTVVAQPESNQDPPPKKKVLYIRMELCDLNLRQYLHTCQLRARQLRADEVWHVMDALVAALEYLDDREEKIVHRDIKPANILLKKNTGNEEAGQVALLRCTVKLGDFGLAKSEGRGGSGTELYKSPEQEEQNVCSTKSDIYSLGAVLLEMLRQPRNDNERVDLLTRARRGMLPPELDRCEHSLLLTEKSGMLHHSVPFRSDVTAVKNHIKSWHTNSKPAGKPGVQPKSQTGPL